MMFHQSNQVNTEKNIEFHCIIRTISKYFEVLSERSKSCINAKLIFSRNGPESVLNVLRRVFD